MAPPVSLPSMLPPAPPCGVGGGVVCVGCSTPPRPPLVWRWRGCLGFRCIDMKGFTVEGEQLGAAQTETVANQRKINSKIIISPSSQIQIPPVCEIQNKNPTITSSGTNRFINIYGAASPDSPLHGCFPRIGPAMLRVVGLFTRVV